MECLLLILTDVLDWPVCRDSQWYLVWHHRWTSGEGRTPEVEQPLAELLMLGVTQSLEVARWLLCFLTYLWQTKEPDYINGWLHKLEQQSNACQSPSV